ncbi:hypothetical protein IH879_18290 [candidate division KSB1 bacterium]|nr:hypothetical protein [candidate division KSB1 bacterium]
MLIQPIHITRASLDRFNAQRSKKPTADAFPSSSGNHATEAGQVHAQLAPTDATKPTTITKGKHLKARTDLRNRKRSIDANTVCTATHNIIIDFHSISF